MPRHRGYKRKRRSRRRQPAWKRQRSFNTRVLRVLDEQQPEKLQIVHLTKEVSAALNKQEMQFINVTGAFQKYAGETAYGTNMALINVVDMFTNPKVDSTTYTGSDTLGVGDYSPNQMKVHVKSQKCRVMMTNSSTATQFCELYMLYPRHDIPYSTQLTTDALLNANNLADFTTPGFDTSSGVSNGVGTAVTYGTPGVTPYDCPVLTKAFYIKRLGIKRLESGANAIINVKVGARDFSGMDYLEGALDFLWIRGYTKLLLCRIWGEMVAGTTYPCMAPVKLITGTICRTKWALRIEPNFAAQAIAGTDATSMSTGTAPIMYVEENPATTVATGVTASTL